MRHIAVVFARLVGTAEQHITDSRPVHLRVARHQRLERDGPKIVGAHARERATVATEGGADGVADVGGGHGDESNRRIELVSRGRRASIGLQVQTALGLEGRAHTVPVQPGLLRHLAQRQHHAFFHALEATHIKTGVGIG